jgi:hypothetical protein
MATWTLSPQHKKSAVEKMFFFKEGKIIIREEGFRWATFSVESDERPLTDSELKNEDYYELGCIDNDESWEMQDMTDGCWADVTAGNDKTTDEDLAAFNDAWEADWYSGVEAIGWSQDECECYFYGPLVLSNKDTGEEFYGGPPETVKEFVEGYAEHIENMSDEEWDNLGKDDNPYTDWFPASINPVRIGTYQVLDTEQEVAWPFQSNVLAGTWDGTKWDISASTNVIKWRGLNKEPK